MNPELDPIFEALWLVIILFFVVLFLIGIAIKLHGFARELDYINREIGRTTGEEQRYWRQQKRRLWLSLLPFYRG